MIKELHDFTKEERAVHEVKTGTFNQFPPGWRELTESEYAERSMYNIYTPTFVEYRQMFIEYRQMYFDGLKPGSAPAVSAHLWWFHDGTGEALVISQHERKVRFFKFGCEHAYVEVSRPAGHRSGLHEDRCTKCGHRHVYDTSD